MFYVTALSVFRTVECQFWGEWEITIGKEFAGGGRSSFIVLTLHYFGGVGDNQGKIVRIGGLWPSFEPGVLQYQSIHPNYLLTSLLHAAESFLRR